MASVSSQQDDIWKEETLPNFRDVWLGCDEPPENGRIYVMYYLTTMEGASKIKLNGFEQSDNGSLGRGVYVCRDFENVVQWAKQDTPDQVILKLRVNVGKAIKIDKPDHPLLDTWHDHGYDTAWVPAYWHMVDGGLEENCIWDPKRIKVVAPYPIDTKNIHRE